MKIAVIGHVRFPIARPFMGGMEAHCWHLCRGLRARGHDVQVQLAATAALTDFLLELIDSLAESFDL